jgi:hypothetical protein
VRIGRQEDDKGRLRREIVVNQVRAMASDAVILPNESPRKVYLIDEADTMNPAAQNAALKLLEEPPRGVYFLLCVTNPALLLPTVRSRCAEIGDNAGEQTQDPEALARAEDFLRLVAKGDRAGLFAFTGGEMDRAALDGFLEAASGSVAEQILGRADAQGLPRRELLRLRALLERCRDYSKVNTGIKLILGLLAVDAIADEEKQRSIH